MTRTYETVDADGHILEPLTLWDDYIDPAFRDRGVAAKLVARVKALAAAESASSQA